MHQTYNPYDVQRIKARVHYTFDESAFRGKTAGDSETVEDLEDAENSSQNKRVCAQAMCVIFVPLTVIATCSLYLISTNAL